MTSKQVRVQSTETSVEGCTDALLTAWKITTGAGQLVASVNARVLVKLIDCSVGWGSDFFPRQERSNGRV